MIIAGPWEADKAVSPTADGQLKYGEMVAWEVLLLLAALWLLPGVLTDLVLLIFIAKQLLRDKRSSAPCDDAKLLLVGLLLGFILLPLLIAAPLSGYLASPGPRPRRGN